MLIEIIQPPGSQTEEETTVRPGTRTKKPRTATTRTRKRTTTESTPTTEREDDDVYVPVLILACAHEILQNGCSSANICTPPSVKIMSMTRTKIFVNR
ncbi:hypothetical protein KIN20_009911 [Parelaphostrongylus tenuis]|uniref:Uncharacterized protein n=1 Tax=Parelaphostrongylus tenuis TaxID=148309 RepID=A0AAD5MYC8_PARTN|nr:hypothetical protein KIN20_009911 [Parelaphostrongylus tenuis]